MEHILRVLNKHNGNKPAAAAELGIVLKTLYNKLNQWEEERAGGGLIFCMIPPFDEHGYLPPGIHPPRQKCRGGVACRTAVS